jgi:hypothetical protein
MWSIGLQVSCVVDIESQFPDMFSHLLSHFPLTFLPCRPYTDTWSIVKFVMELNVDAQVHATTDALALIWDIDPHSTQEIAHALAIYLAADECTLQRAVPLCS